MFGSAVLDIVIGLAFGYFILSIAASSANELISQIMAWRASTLKDGIRTLLDDPDLDAMAKSLYEHPLISSLGKPSYLPASRFADALIDTVDQATLAANMTATTVAEAIEQVPSEGVKQQLQLLMAQAGGNLDEFRKGVATWFDQGMDRVSGVYKRKTRWVILAVGTILVVLFNFDTFAVAGALDANPAVRDAIVADVAARTAGDVADVTLKDALQALDDMDAGMGWRAPEFCQPDEVDCDNMARVQAGIWYLVGRLPGWLVSVLAISLGAPFWFDTLSRLSNLRATGTKP